MTLLLAYEMGNTLLTGQVLLFLGSHKTYKFPLVSVISHPIPIVTLIPLSKENRNMGGALQKFAAGSEEKAKEINEIIDKCYEAHFTGTTEQISYVKFFRAVCETVEDINKKLGNTQFRVPKITALNYAYKKHFKTKGTSLNKDDFQDMLKEVIFDTGVTGIGGAKDLILYIFGVPITAFVIKQSIMPRVIPNEVFIPSITSATVFILAKLNKI